MKKIFTGMLVGIMAFVAMTTPTMVEAEEVKETKEVCLLDVESEETKNFVSDQIVKGITRNNGKAYAKFAHPKCGPFVKQIVYYVTDYSTNTTMVAIGGRDYADEYELTVAYIVSGIVVPDWKQPDLWM